MAEPGSTDNPVGGRQPTEAGALDWARALEAVERTAQHLQASLTTDALGREVVAALQEILGYEFAAVLLLDPMGRLQPFAISDQGRGAAFEEADRAFLQSQDLLVGRGVTGWVAESGHPARIGDVRDDPRYMAIRSDIRSELCVPLVADGRPIGVINIESIVADRYTAMDEQVLRIVAAQIAVAIHNAMLHDRVLAAQERMHHVERLEAASRVAGGAAHDVRNVLTSVRGYAQLAIVGLSPTHPVRQDLQSIIQATDRGAVLADQLMDMGRSFSLRPALVDLRVVIEALRGTLEGAVGHGTTIRLDPGNHPAWAVVDPRAVERILVNLVTNAGDASPAGSTVEVRIERAAATTPDEPGALTWLEVVDHGSGMDPNTLEHALVAFYTTKPSGEGTGLGLAVVEGLVAASGGEVVIQSALGIGTTIRVGLPATSVGDPVEEANAAPR